MSKALKREVLEGLNLERIRPWIIVIEATEPSSTASTRDEWEHLITDRGYGFAYFDGLNCFYVADEVAALKERLAVPPNVFDDFVRFPEWAIRQEAGAAASSVAGRAGTKCQSAQRAASRTGANCRSAQRRCKRSRHKPPI